MIEAIVSAAITMAIVHTTGVSIVPAVLIAIAVPVALFALYDAVEAEPQRQIKYGNNGMTIEELAQELDTPTWILAPTMVRLIKRGLLAPPDGITPDDQITHLETAYPKPQNVISKSPHSAD